MHTIPNHEIETLIEKKSAARDRKRRQKMKISGASVKNLQKIIIHRAKT